MTARERLPDRRANQSFTFELNGLRYHATISCFADGRVGEVFITNTKPSSAAESLAARSARRCIVATGRGARHRRGAVMSVRARRVTRQLEILALRSMELADRVAAGELKFLDAVDVAYEAALWSGLTETAGDDIVQATIAAAFANARAPA